MADTVVLGRITGHFGVRGWVRVDSHTRPPAQILDYDRCLVGQDGAGEHDAAWQPVRVEQGTGDGGRVRLKLSGCDSREDAAPLIGCLLGVDETLLAPLPDGEYYWRDLIGMAVAGPNGERLGRVVRMLETGANDVVVVGPAQPGDEPGEVLVPWVPDVIVNVDLPGRVLTVNWQRDY